MYLFGENEELVLPDNDTNLTSLTINNMGLEDISFLEEYKISDRKYIRLDLSNNNINFSNEKDKTILRKILSEMEHGFTLKLSNNGISDISFLEGLEDDVISLDLTFNNIDFENENNQKIIKEIVSNMYNYYGNAKSIQIGGQGLDLNVEYVDIPDESLKRCLINEYDLNKDGEMQVEEMKKVERIGNILGSGYVENFICPSTLKGLEYAVYADTLSILYNENLPAQDFKYVYFIKTLEIVNGNSNEELGYIGVETGEVKINGIENLFILNSLGVYNGCENANFIVDESLVSNTLNDLELVNTSIEYEKGLENLQKFAFEGNGKDATPYIDFASLCKKIWNLQIGVGSFENYEGLEKLSNVTHLITGTGLVGNMYRYSAGNRNTSETNLLENLVKMQGLENLSFGGFYKIDGTKLKDGFENLKSLKITGNVNYLSFLKNCPKLKDVEYRYGCACKEDSMDIEEFVEVQKYLYNNNINFSYSSSENGKPNCIYVDLGTIPSNRTKTIDLFSKFEWLEKLYRKLI